MLSNRSEKCNQKRNFSFAEVEEDTGREMTPLLKKNIWTGLDWTGLDWTGLDWTGLDWTGLDWTGLDWTGQTRTIKTQTVNR